MISACSCSMDNFSVVFDRWFTTC